MTTRAQRTAITGASGFIGSAVARALEARGETVVRIGRGEGSDARWDPASGTLDDGALDGVGAVVHLAGASIAQRWTPAWKREIEESRVQGTRLIAERCARLATPPAVLVSGSAIGIYGSRGDEWLDERSTAGDDFLAGVAQAWEEATRPAEEAGIRVVHLRTGIVLHPRGGALRKMLLPFQLGVGGRLGDGRQWMSWISREDLVRAIVHAIETPTIRGAVNAVAPEPVTNRTFTETLARILRRPALIPAPAFALRAALGEMAEGTVLASQRVRPTVLQASGFEFRHPSLASALRFELDAP